MVCECRQSFVRRQESSVVFTMANSIDLKSTVTLEKTGNITILVDYNHALPANLKWAHLVSGRLYISFTNQPMSFLKNESIKTFINDKDTSRVIFIKMKQLKYYYDSCCDI